MFKSTFSLRLRALALVAVVFAVMFGMVAYHAVVGRADDIDDAKTHLLHASEKIAAEQQQIVAHADQYLLRLIRLPQVREIATRLTQLKSAPDEGCSRFLAAELKEAPAFMGMGVIAPNGDVLCNALQPKTPINVSDRRYFQAAIKTRGLVISDVVVARANNTSTISFARALPDDTESVRGVVWVSLNFAWLHKQLANAMLPQGAHVGLLDARGTVVAHYPDQEDWMGRNASGTPLFEGLVAKGGKGTFEALGLDGIARVYALTPFADTVGGRIVLWLSIPKQAITASADRDFTWTLAITTALLLLTFGGVWVGAARMVLRPVAALSLAAQRLAQGDLDARTGVRDDDSELGRLAHAFDDMAASIKSEKTELTRTNRALRVLSAGNRTLLHATDEMTLCQQMCRAIVESGGYNMAWVGYAQEDEGKSVQPVASFGAPKDFLEALRISWANTERGQGPTGTAIRQGTPVGVQNMLTDPSVQPWRALALRYHYASVLALPLRENNAVIGVLAIHANEPDAFGEEEKALLDKSAADLSYGIATQRARVRETHLEASLKTAEDRFRAAAEANLDALAVLKSVRDGAGSIVDFEFAAVNASAEKMLGRARYKIIGQKLCELLPTNRTGGFFDKYAQVVSTGEPLEEEFHIDTPETKAKWLRQQVVKVGDGVAISSRDITAWKQVGDQLRESEFRYRQLFEANPHPMWVYDLATLRFLMVNDAAVKHYGYSRDEFQAMTIADIRPPTHVPRLLENVAQVENGKTDEAGIWQHCKKDGTLIDVEITSHVFYFGEKRAEMVLAHDVTAQRRAEAERRKADTKFKAIFEQAPVGVVIIDLETGMPTEFNDVAHNQLNYSRDEFARLRISDYEALESVEQIKAHMREILRKRGDDFETRHRTKSGELRNVHVMMRVLESGDQRSLYSIYQDITEQKKGAIALEKSNRALRTLSAANEALVRATSEHELLQSVCRIIVEKSGSPMVGVCYAQDGEEKGIKSVAWAGAEQCCIDEEIQTWTDAEHGQRPISRTIRSGKPEVDRDIPNDPTLGRWREVAVRHGYSSILALPLPDGTRIFGGLCVYSPEPDAFHAEEIRLLEELANDLAYGVTTLRTKAERDRIAYEHEHHEEILRKSLEDSIQAIADTVEMRDPYTAGHQRRVGELAVAIAREMGLPEDKVHGIRLAASIHDLGKITVPAEILAKPGKLTNIEFMLIKAHAQAGYDILKDISFPWPIATIVWQHHERLDGTGYPQGLKSDQILLESRIMAVADVAEAMASHRPYRPSLGIEATLAEIERGRGTAYDPVVADACLKLFREKGYAIPA